jgi:hypothetical protein
LANSTIRIAFFAARPIGITSLILARAIFEHENDTARGADAGDNWWRERETDAIRDRGQLLTDLLF